MAKQFASLERIENDRKITKETDYEFLHHLQTGLLLALKEQGRLNEIQYRHAQEKLNQQLRDVTRKNQQKGGTE